MAKVIRNIGHEGRAAIFDKSKRKPTMGSSYLPPGCSLSDIPGNHPEDEEAEAFGAVCDGELQECGLTFDKKGSPIFPRKREEAEACYEKLHKFLWKLRNEARAEGREEARQEEAMARQLAEIDRAAATIADLEEDDHDADCG